MSAPERLRLTLLGTGTSVGVPMIGCACPTCLSTDPRDRRYRTSAYLEWDAAAAVIDTTPEFRLQMLRVGARRLDAVLLTHNHADHVNGLDDVRPFTAGTDRRLPVYGGAEALGWIRKRYDYVWEARQKGGGLPRIDLVPVDAPFEIAGVEFVPVPVWHGKLASYGYRFGDCGYVPDVSAIPDSSKSLLAGLRVLFLDAVRYEPHATHFHVDAAVEAAREIGAETTYLFHMNHDIRHAQLADELPEGIEPAYDGLSVEVRV